MSPQHWIGYGPDSGARAAVKGTDHFLIHTRQGASRPSILVTYTPYLATLSTPQHLAADSLLRNMAYNSNSHGRAFIAHLFGKNSYSLLTLLRHPD
jgi:hypothetical protein